MDIDEELYFGINLFKMKVSKLLSIEESTIEEFHCDYAPGEYAFQL